MCCCCICCTVSDLILYIVAIIFPPVAVLFRSGLYSSDFLLNVLLTLLGFVPGLIHAFYYITITSPLRRDHETRFYYQAGWEDGRRNGRRDNRGSRSCNHREVVTEQPSAVTPLLATSRKDSDSPSCPPPPYTETV
ncbi:LAFE_0B04104g1_1 [Lachancea fermentati]|uniref:LAFE_0B04104g1_1 n=1 Tax=Lachancea fermentati TaxID=4955 RepID=A0A1G4M7P1_LACFM|nr:LAFE_0B04104g1_1 [Lachancea fermentati]